MEYKEVIGLSDHFQPVVDIQNEVEKYWKKFIPNDQFYAVLAKMLTSLDSNKPEERQPIWLQGTYGTGKSHATTVIKHLLYDDINQINDFEIEKTQLKFQLESFRNKNRVFPVILKGTANVYDNRTFALAIEKAVKEALKKEKITLSKIKTDFEAIISKLRGDEINWNNVFKDTELELYGSKEDIISKLENQDSTILIQIEDILSKKGIAFHKENISTWLEEVINELRKQGVADYLMIYWDEFTGIFELPKFGIILTELQSIAELSLKGIYLFVISHRRPHQTKMAREDVEKILGRFKVLEYSMETITTYHIINASIIKLKNDQWTELKNNNIKPLRSLIIDIVGAEGTNIQKSLGNLFPIHPYTAYLATFIARNIGSTERSIFKFLYDDKNGFNKFINENPGENGEIFLTVDYLWDFFYEDFARSDDIKIISVLERFKLFNKILEDEGSDYLNVFKGILVLNLLYKVVEVTESSLVTPSEINIRNLFTGCISEDKLSQILTFINNRQIIAKNPDDLYILTSSGLNQKEIENEKNKLKKYYKTINNILTKEQKDNIENIIKNSVLREIEISILDNNLTEHLIKSKLTNIFDQKSRIHLCLFLGKDNESFNQITNKLKNISKEKDYESIIFAVSERILEDKEFNQFLSYKASAIVSEKHNFEEDRLMNEEFSRKIIDKWVNSIQSSYIQWFFKGKNGNELMSQFGDKISKDFSRKIFNLGIDNIRRTLKHKTVWDLRYSKKAIEIFLFSDNREEIEERLTSGMEKPLREVIKDNNEEFIIDSSLEFKPNVDDNHPLKAMDSRLREVFEKENGNFNLGIDLKFLNEPPFGLYPNMFCQGAFALLMRSYIGNLYTTGTGTPIQKERMRDIIIDLFKFWENDKGLEKLEVRFGSADEEKLIELLNELFKFGEIKSLNDTRWKIKNWIKEIGYPIWIFRFAKGNNVNSKKAIGSIFKLISSTDSELNKEKISPYLDDIDKAKFELKLVLNKNNYNEMFQKWLETIEDLKISKEDMPEVKKFVFNHMQEEIAHWTEDKTKEMVMRWKVKKQEVEKRKLENRKKIAEEQKRLDQQKVKKELERLEEQRKKLEEEQKRLEEQRKKQKKERERLKEKQNKYNDIKNIGKGQVTLEMFNKKIELCDVKVLRDAIKKSINENPQLMPLLYKYLEG